MYELFNELFFSVVPKKCLLNYKIREFSPVFSSRSFKRCCFILVWFRFSFRFLIHFELCMWCSVWIQDFFSVFACRLVPATFVEKAFFLPVLPFTFVKCQLTICAWVLFWTLICFIHLSILT